MLRLEDLKVGMRVDYHDLDHIFETVMIMSDLEGNDGVLYYIGEPDTEALENIFAELESDGKAIRPIYNLYTDDEVSYDE